VLLLVNMIFDSAFAPLIHVHTSSCLLQDYVSLCRLGLPRHVEQSLFSSRWYSDRTLDRIYTQKLQYALLLHRWGTPANCHTMHAPASGHLQCSTALLGLSTPVPTNAGCLGPSHMSLFIFVDRNVWYTICTR
jgi:hypothetical protein